MRSAFAREGTALNHLFLLEKGIPLPGVEHQGHLTAFQRMSLQFAEEYRSELQHEAAAADGNAPGTGGFQPNAARRANGGGKRVTRRSFVNMSERTGKSPEELIEEYRNKNG